MTDTKFQSDESLQFTYTSIDHSLSQVTHLALIPDSVKAARRALIPGI